MNQTELSRPSYALPLDLIADHYQGYPGEEVTLSLRLITPQTITGQIALNLWLPPGLTYQLDSSQAPRGHGPAHFIAEPGHEFGETVERFPRYQVIFWRLAGDQLELGQSYEYRVKGQFDLTQGRDLCLKIWAEVTQSPAEVGVILLYQSFVLTLHVLSKARALQYLPGLYHDAEHELMWRYLMIFDRVWATYEELLANQSFYFDPHMAPANFQNWLAALVGLDWLRFLPPSLHQNLKPHLIPKIVSFYQKRGTRQGLQEFLQFCLSGLDNEVEHSVKIEETMAGNFILDDATELNDELILGSPEDEVCHFIVTVDWPDEQHLYEALVHQIIEIWKPVHTTYELATAVRMSHGG